VINLFEINLLSGPTIKDAAYSMLLSKGNEERIFDLKDEDINEMKGSIYKYGIEKGHDQIIKHIDMMFLIKGLSRGGFDEIRTHEGFAKFMAKSTRYCNIFEIGNWPLEKFSDEEITDCRFELEALANENVDNDIRSRKFPLYVETPFTLKVNLLHFIHILEQRKSSGAHEELRFLVDDILECLNMTKDKNGDANWVCNSLLRANLI
jgi:thymidylate synthase ThyX